MKRIGILTSGGDCQGLNAAIRGVAKALYVEFGSDVEIYGIADGYRGLIEGDYRLMKPEDFSGILPRRYHSRHLAPTVQIDACHR